MKPLHALLSALDALAVNDLQAGDVATLYDGTTVVASAPYDGLPTIGSDACIGHSTFLATRGATATIVDAGAYHALGGSIDWLASSWTGETSSTVSVERPLDAGDVAYVETVVHDGLGIETRSSRAKALVPGYTRPERTPPAETPPVEQVIATSPVAPTTAQALQAVKAALSATGSNLRTFTPRQLARKSTVTLPFAFPEPGAVELQPVAKGKVIGTGTRSAAVNGKSTVTVTLPTAGRKLLKRSKKLKVAVDGTFTPSRTGAETQRASSSVTIKR